MMADRAIEGHFTLTASPGGGGSYSPAMTPLLEGGCRLKVVLDLLLDGSGLYPCCMEGESVVDG